MKSLAFHIILVCTSVVLTAPVSSQSLKFKGPDPKKAITQYNHESWNTEHGLPQNSVTTIAQSPDGYLWLGTQEGLVRFDGVQFTVFDKNNTPELRHNYISALYVEKNSGKIWIGTLGGGVTTYVNQRFTHIDSIDDLHNGQIRSIYRDMKGSLWISTRDNGSVIIDSVSHRSIKKKDGLPSNDVWKVLNDRKGRYWFATDFGVSVLDGTTLYHLNESNGLASKQAFVFLENHEGSVWIGTQDGLQLVSLENGTFKTHQLLTVKDGLPGKGVYNLRVDQQGNFWIGTSNGIARIYNQKIETFTVKQGLSSRLINAIYIDREGNLWIGTDGGGLDVIRDGVFTSYTMKEGLPNNIAWTIYEDSKKQLWFGTDDGLTLFNSEKQLQKIFNKENGLSHYIVWSVAEDLTGAIWVGTANGLNKIVNNTIVELPTALKFKDNAISSVYCDSKGTMWLATADEGLYRVRGSSIKQYTVATGLSSNYVSCAYEDRDGKLWVGTDGGGIAILSGDSIVATLTIKDGLPSDIIQAFHQDADGNMWIGTFGEGLGVYHNGAFKKISVKNGLFDDVIFQILEDGYGRIWMSCNKGVFFVNRNELIDFVEDRVKKVTYTSYGTENGMASAECNGGSQPAGWKASDGTLWFPTSYGIATVDPKNIAINQTPPLVVLEEILIDNQSYKNDDAHIVPPGKQRYEFRYTGLSFDGPKKVKFKIMLEGYDQEWYEVGKRRAAYYSHLPPGDYELRVIAANADGVWNTTGVSYPFTVQAFFYQTRTFYIVLILGFVVFVYGFFRYRTRQIIKRQHELEQLVEVRTKDLKEAQERTEQLLHEAQEQRGIAEKANSMKTQLLYIAAHDLKSPLMSIEGWAKEIALTPNLDDHTFEQVKMIQIGAARMVSLIADLLNLSSIESGKLNFNFETINASEVAALIVSGYETQVSRKKQTIKFTADPNVEYLVSADPSRLQEAIENLLSNAIKYSPLEAQIEVGVRIHEQSVRIWVRDQGPGFTEDDQHRMFKRFQKLSARPTGNEISTGLGLAIVKEIVDTHNGAIFLETEVGKGSTFFIDLPHITS